MTRHTKTPLWITAVVLTAMLGARPASARAQSEDPDDARADAQAGVIDPAGPAAVGRVLTAGRGSTGPTLLASGGYGYTGSVLGRGDTHHRIAGALTLDERALPWLSFALRFDGRYDAHLFPGQPTDTGLVGDPRFYVRVDHDWPSGLRIAARAGLWLPGGNAPSLVASALSPELVGVASYAAPDSALAISANAGYRLDRSARSAPDAAALGPGDRLALEVSAFDEVLVGMAATLGRGQAQGFIEASGALLVGAGAPALSSSPIFVGGGGRWALGRNVRLEAEVEVSPSSRPDTGPTAPLVPIPPRVSVWMGAAFRFDGETSPTPAPRPGRAPPPTSIPTPTSTAAPGTERVEPDTVQLIGRVSAVDGKLAGLRVEVTTGGSPRQVPADESGRFTVQGQPGDELMIAAEATGHLPARASITLTAGPNELDLRLKPRPPQGQIRGLVRSLRGAALAADVAILPETGEASDGDADSPAATRRRTEAGRFQVDVSPGRYRVTISAPGYQRQQRRVDVEENGVTLLNVDLRSER